VIELDVGQIVGGKYVLIRLLGAGAMGQVWAARHQALQQPFAVKLLVPPKSVGQPFEGVETSLRRFRNEAQIAAALSRKSRHIAQVIDYGIDGDTAFLVMELLEGSGLDRLVGRGEKLDPAQVSVIVAQIGKALTVAHAEGVTHRDLKPANVFVTKTEEGETLVKLLDFGIAQMARRIVRTKGDEGRAPTRLTIKGLVLGSPAYMSPEQAMADSPDARADVWSLAVLAYEALAGVTPFHGETADATIVRICNFDATPLRDVMPDASEALAAVFARAFQSRIAARFQTAGELASALAAALPAASGAPILSLTAGTAPPSNPSAETAAASLVVPLRPRRVAPVLAAGACVALVVSGVLFGPHLFASRAPSAVPAVDGPVASARPSVDVPPPPPTASAIPVSALPAVPHETAHETHVGPRHSATITPPATSPPPPASAKSVDRSAVF